MFRERYRLDSRWRTALCIGLGLVIGSVIPSPFGRHPQFRRVGPDKFLHAVGHAVFAAALADASADDGVDERIASCLAVAGSVSLGLVIGALQRYVPGRLPERADIAAGALGSVGGIAGWWYRSGT